MYSIFQSFKTAFSKSTLLQKVAQKHLVTKSLRWHFFMKNNKSPWKKKHLGDFRKLPVDQDFDPMWKSPISNSLMVTLHCLSTIKSLTGLQRFIRNTLNWLFPFFGSLLIFLVYWSLQPLVSWCSLIKHCFIYLAVRTDQLTHWWTCTKNSMPDACALSSYCSIVIMR